MDEDGYDPEDPGMATDKARSASLGGQQGSQGQRKASGSYRLKRDTLVVEKIPAEHCSQENINEYFKRFGKILNVSVDKNQLKAEIQYENIPDAQAAHSCPDSIFGNRFVKAYFLREYNENGTRSTNGLDSQKRSNAQGSAPMDVEPVKPPQLVFFEKGKQLMELQRNQEAIIAQQIEASKVLMAQLAAPDISPSEKKVLLEQLKVLQDSNKSLVEKASEHTSKMLKMSNSSSQDNLERQRLDRELEVLNQMAAASDEATESSALKSKLEALQAEARALGIPGYAPPMRGRGRGGRFARGGRGSARSLRLDNRSKKLLVTGTSQNFQNALNQHCQVFYYYLKVDPYWH
jgi:RNA-binding protein 26